MKFAAEHASAYAEIAENGEAITLGSVPGVAIAVKGDANEYAALGLIERNPVSLLFAATTYGDKVTIGETGTWAEVTRTVASVNATAPDGVPIVSRVVMV